MKFKSLGFISIIVLFMVLFTGCNKEYSYSFEQDIENVVSVELMEYDYDTRSTTPIITLDEETATALLNDIPTIPCYRHFGDHGTGYGVVILYITYENDESEVIGVENCARVDESGEWVIQREYFDFYDWYDLIYKYVDKETVPQLEEWYQYLEGLYSEKE